MYLVENEQPLHTIPPVDTLTLVGYDLEKLDTLLRTQPPRVLHLEHCHIPAIDFPVDKLVIVRCQLEVPILSGSFRVLEIRNLDLETLRVQHMLDTLSLANSPIRTLEAGAQKVWTSGCPYLEHVPIQSRQVTTRHTQC